jgi:hypothetical protein
MYRLDSATQTPLNDRASASVEEGLPLRLVDVVITLLGTLASAYLVLAGRWVPGWLPSAIVYAVIAAGPPVLRAVARRFPNRPGLDLMASFWLLPSVIAGHCFLGPVADAVNPRLMDAYLAYADQRVFGGSPSVLVEPYVRGAITEGLLLSYYTYYIWPLALGVTLYVQQRRAAFDQYLLALGLFFGVNFLLYVAVPAIGPRFFLARDFELPLQGLWLTSYLDGLMRGAAFTRDCFPSGHTGATLVVLTYAFWHARKLFWIMLPFALGLIGATIVGRFHYGVDLLCAVPLMMAAVNAAGWLAKARPHGVVLPVQSLAFRQG